MRYLSSSLLAAQKASIQTPAVAVQARNNMNGVVNLKWSRLYTGSEPDYYHALTIPGDGSLIRLRITPPADGRKLYRQRVVNPGPGSDFSQWTYLNQYNVANCAACSLGNEVSLFWVKSNGEIDRIKSLDNGATWQAVDYPGYAPTGAVGGMSAAYKPNGDLALFFGDISTLYVIKRISGAWQTRTAWNKSTGNISSAAVVYDGDWKLLVSGRETDGTFKIWSLVYGDGGEVTAGSWSDLKTLVAAPADSAFELVSVFMDKIDGVYRCFYIEKFNGSEASNRPFWSHTLPETSFLENRWREPVPFETESSSGLAIAHTSNYAWLSTTSGVWRSARTALSYELSNDILRLKQTLLPDFGKAEIELRNDKGQYTSPGQDVLSMLDTGCQIDISPGFRTAAGNEYSAGQTYILESYEYNTGPGKSSFILEASDGWILVKNWIARYQFRWNQTTDEANVKEIMAQVLARCGIKLETISQSSVVTGFFPDFTIHPGENGREVIERLLSFVPDLIFIEGLKAFLINPLVTDASIYDYGSDHPIFEGRYRTSGYKFNRIRVEGASVLSESFAWPEISKNGDKLDIIEDLNADTPARTHERGDAQLRKYGIEAMSGFIRIPVNCGQQIYDVISISDPRVRLGTLKRRILGISLAFTPLKSIYDQKLILGDV